MFQEMRRQLIGDMKTSGGPKKGGGGAAEAADPGAFLAEMHKNSPYQLQIQDNIEKFGPVIKELAKEVANFAATDMKLLVEFVNSTDDVLDELVDEHAVLKAGGFDWPKKYQTFREAKVMYDKLQAKKLKFKEWPRNPRKSITDELADIQKFMVSF